MIKAIDANMYLYLFVENIAPIQEIDTANCIYCFNHYRNIFFTLNVHNNDNDLIVANVFIIASVKYIYFSKRPRRCSSYSQLNHCLIIIQTIQRIGDFGLFKLDYPQI